MRMEKSLVISRSFLAATILLPSTLLCAVHTVHPEIYYSTFSAKHAPVEHVLPGDTIRTKTLDAAGGDEKGINRDPHGIGNPLTGPFYVEGAEPGDALVVHILQLRMNRNWGWTVYHLGSFSLPHGYSDYPYPAKYKTGLVHTDTDNQVPWALDLTMNSVHLKEPTSARIKMEFPAHLMLGCFGVAAPGATEPDSSTSGPYGGNMDYNQVAEGNSVLLPVYHEGALLYFGDGHALQGDGEPMGTGIETSFDVEVTITVQKHAELTGPRLETAEDIISVGSLPEFASSLDRALEMANADMVRWLVSDYGLEPWAANVLIGVQGHYQVVTVAGSMALRMPKRYLPSRRQHTSQVPRTK